MPNLTKHKSLSNSITDYPISVKKATLVDKYWLAANDSYVATHTFHITFKQLHHLATTFKSTDTHTKYFEIISAMIWKCIAQIRGDYGPRVVTISTTNVSNGVENEFSRNDFVLSRVETNLSPGESNLSELVNLIAEKKMNENHVLKKLMEESDVKGDFVVYGAKLTFVDLEEGDFYGVKINGKKPVMVNCDIRGVGDEGVVLVLPGPEDNDGNNGRMVTISLPGKELDQLKGKLEKEWGIQYYSRLGC
ncbi:hypothetical protein KIW84_051605 [Lathyrus oleraceus]|nr:hypothetical protein KIW84_051605 [Pisum sativum]